MEYTNLTNLKLYLNITGDTLNTELTNIIKAVSGQFDLYLGRNLETNTFIEYIDIEEVKEILTDYKINSIDYVKLDDVDV
jgi:hypothetical protein